MNFDYSGHDQQRVPQRTPRAWLAALDVDGELTFLDVSPILVDGPDQVLEVLWHRTSGKVDRLWVDSDAGALWAYVSRPAAPPSSPLRRPASNPRARLLLRRLGVEVTYCVGAVLFLAAHGQDEAGLSSEQQLLLRRHADPLDRAASGAEPVSSSPHAALDTTVEMTIRELADV